MARIAALLFAAAISLARTAAAEGDVERVFDASVGLARDWTDLGWAQREVRPGAPARLFFSEKQGWILARPGLRRRFQSLTFRMRAPKAFGDFLEVRLEPPQGESLPRVRVAAGHRKEAGDGWTAVSIPMTALNPKNAFFEQIVFQAAKEVGPEPVELDAIALNGSGQREVRLSVDCAAPRHPISPLIYGTAHGDDGWWLDGTSARRWGGNPNTRYNWELGTAWNAGKDWFFKNADYSRGASRPAWESFLEEDVAHQVPTAFTVPMIGWVAKDRQSYSFPVSVFGPQQAVAPENPDMGNGVGRDGKLLAPDKPTRTSVAAPPEFIAKWVSRIRASDQSRNVAMYILDNEPTLWSSTHRDVHPAPVSYDELLDRTVRYGSAVRAADPQATIAGFVGWGWTSLFYSAVDVAGAMGFADRLAHGNVPLLPWWLGEVRAQEKKSGTRLIDVLDVHYYPQGANIGIEKSGGTDPDTAARRIRSVRSFWDPKYRDESWINDEVRLIPRLRDWIAQEAPGVGISIGEWNFGAEGHMSGGLAVAEALGHFGVEGIHSAFYWTSPERNSPAFWAFRAFRNFDGKGGRFLDESIPAKSSDPLVSIFASHGPDGQAVLVVLNEEADLAARTTLDLASCGKVRASRTFHYTGSASGFQEAQSAASPGSSLRDVLPAYSVTVYDLHLSR